MLLFILVLPATAAAQSHTSVTQNPHGPLNIPCQNCHTLSAWRPIRSLPEFDHNRTRFPLRGMHQSVGCTDCHTKPVFTNVGHRCADCHADIHKGHFGASCDHCHNVKGWQVSVQQINEHQNRFPLLGAHALLDCASCHKSAAVGQFRGLPTQCYACHAADFQQAQPNHVSAGFPTGCEQCHGMNNWLGAKFDHLKMTGFALQGAHALLDCSACHIGGRFQGTPAACVGCHLPDYQGATNPNHVALAFPQTCQTCHSTTAWQPATFDHSAVGFPLTGAHQTLQCASCHTNGNFNLTSTACISCHLKDYQGTTDPNHAQIGFSQVCQGCHTTVSWAGATFNHATTGFALTGAHAALPCSQCHVNGNYNLTTAACSSCHMKDFQATTNPNHVQGGFPTTCDSCHSTVTWAGATFDHSSTGFPLTGAHVALQCTQCHINGNYNITDTSCSSCHTKDFNSTTNPNHVIAGFPLQCQLCHTTTAWTPSSFNHNNTVFPLTGFHTTVACASCHVNNNYTTVPTDCYSCHKSDYLATTNPNHTAANFPTTCATCHSTTSWLGATFNHTYFPLNHGGANSVCSTCHTNSSNYAVFTCTNCHTQAQTDARHQGIRGYVYNSTNCYQCHRN